MSQQQMGPDGPIGRRASTWFELKPKPPVLFRVTFFCIETYLRKWSLEFFRFFRKGTVFFSLIFQSFSDGPMDIFPAWGWSLGIIAQMLVHTVTEGSTIVTWWRMNGGRVAVAAVASFMEMAWNGCGFKISDPMTIYKMDWWFGTLFIFHNIYIYNYKIYGIILPDG